LTPTNPKRGTRLKVSTLESNLIWGHYPMQDGLLYRHNTTQSM
jgi:hypothetical protein